MKQYLILNSEWKVLYGDFELTLLNLQSGQILEINGFEFKLFKMWHHGEPVQINSEDNRVKELIEFIKIHNIGKFEESFYVSEEYHIGKVRELYSEKRVRLTRAFLEIAGTCFEDCDYCSKKMTSPCWVCGKPENNEEIGINIYCQIIDLLSQQGCEQIVIHGGNVFEYSHLSILLKQMEECNICPCILTSEALLSKMDFNIVTDFNVSVVVSVDCTKEVMIEKFIHLQKFFLEYNVDVKYSVILSKNTIRDYLKIENELDIHCKDIVNVSLITEEKITQEELEGICLVRDIGQEEFKILSQMNMCMAGMIAINSFLEVTPCPYMRKFIFGKILMINNKLKYVKETDDITLSDFWLTSKPYIEQCSGCSKMHICMDCRAVELMYGKKTDSRFRKRECYYKNFHKFTSNNL